jgi:hypothetical protein
VIQPLTQGNHLWRTRFHTESAALALVHIHPQLTAILLLHIRHCHSSPANGGFSMKPFILSFAKASGSDTHHPYLRAAFDASAPDH